MTVCVKLPDDISLKERDLCDLEMLLMGAFAPLTGYLTRDEYLSVLKEIRLPTGQVWPMPIVLPIAKSATTESDASPIGHVIKLRDSVGVIVAEVVVQDVYEPDLELEMNSVLGTTDLNHPHAKYLHENHSNCYYIGGSVKMAHPIMHFDFQEYRCTTQEVKAYIASNNWNQVVGFQTRNPMTRSHFELTRQAMEEVGPESKLLLTPAVGPTQKGDVEYHIRVRCYKKILKYYPANSVKLVLLPLAMRMAGPREALWHAMIRRNFGCTHFIVGRDHAGPTARKADGSTFYGPYDAHEMLTRFQDELGVKPVFGKDVVYMTQEGTAGSYIQRDKLPEGAETKSISGTRFREMLMNYEEVPEWFAFPEVVQELRKEYSPGHQRGICIYFTGLPCSGKTTLANAVYAKLLEQETESRRVTILDADIIRQHLSKGLGFSREDRQVNVRRIGYVASEIVKHRGICLVANIAPYEEDRAFNRNLVEEAGGVYLEVYVSTPIEVCEQRDIKELYKKARQGVLKQFTGVSDPYELPVNPSLVVNSSADIELKVSEVVDMLSQKGFILPSVTAVN